MARAAARRGGRGRAGTDGAGRWCQGNTGEREYWKEREREERERRDGDGGRKIGAAHVAKRELSALLESVLLTLPGSGGVTVSAWRLGSRASLSELADL